MTDVSSGTGGAVDRFSEMGSTGPGTGGTGTGTGGYGRPLTLEQPLLTPEQVEQKRKEEEQRLKEEHQQRFGVIVLAAGIALLAIGYAYRIEVWKLIFGGLQPNGFFYVLALLPGAVAIMHHVMATRAQHRVAQRSVESYYDFTCQRSEHRTIRGRTREALPPARLASGICSALFLTAVFLLLAAVVDYDAFKPGAALRPVDGIIFSGLGAYISVLYFLTARIYANAVSSRFLTTSALRVASTLAFGWAAVSIGMTNILPNGATPIAALFMSGLFFSWAINALRNKAMTALGAPKTDNEELPLGIIKGIDDTTADHLSEVGVSTVQHLATSDPADLCLRTLLPLDRIIDWIDQAILVQAVNRNIVAMRGLDVGTATTLARLYVRSQGGDANATKVLDSLGEKSGLGGEALRVIAARFLADFDVRLFYEFIEGRPLDDEAAPPATLTAVVDSAIQRYEVADGRLQIRATPAAPA